MTTQISGTTGVSKVQDGVVVQADLAANVVGNGPAFSAYRTGDFAITPSAMTKVPLITKDFDTSSAFDSTTNFRFQPAIPGYYQMSGALQAGGLTISAIVIALIKNGVEIATNTLQTTITGATHLSISKLVYLNGSTDYVDLFGQINAASATSFAGGQSKTYLTGFLVRAA